MRLLDLTDDAIAFLDLPKNQPETLQANLIMPRTVRLDFSPPVLNLTKEGYKLAGVRLDILEKRRVAAIVYKHQDLFVNAFIRPAADDAIDFDTQFLSGFNLCGWNRSGLNYLIVSELSQIC
jgi:anti-sigma factor RsiW